MSKDNYSKTHDALKKLYDDMGDVIENLYKLNWGIIDIDYGIDDPEVKEVIQSGVATVVKFKNGRKVVTKCQPNDEYDKEKGILFALVKAAYPDWHEIMERWCWHE